MLYNNAKIGRMDKLLCDARATLGCALGGEREKPPP
jgi:hypothetical protein